LQSEPENLSTIVVYDYDFAGGRRTHVGGNMPGDIFGDLMRLMDVFAVQTNWIFQPETINNVKMKPGHRPLSAFQTRQLLQVQSKSRNFVSRQRLPIETLHCRLRINPEEWEPGFRT
jgi:hypothetical protein